MNGLAVRDATVKRGGFPIVREVSLRAPAGRVTVLLGPNGAGKTTLLEGISGLLPLTGGEVTANGQPIHRLPRDERARRGLAHVEQGRAVFDELTVEENLLAAAPRTALRRAFDLFPELAARRAATAGLLSGGEQQMLVLARALLRDPAVLLVDELSLGLAPVVVRRLLPVIREVADGGTAVLLVEQFVHLALRIGDDALVLRRGRVVLDAPCAELRVRPEALERAYLGPIDNGDGGHG